MISAFDHRVTFRPAALHPPHEQARHSDGVGCCLLELCHRLSPLLRVAFRLVARLPDGFAVLMDHRRVARTAYALMLVEQFDVAHLGDMITARGKSGKGKAI